MLEEQHLACKETSPPLILHKKMTRMSSGPGRVLRRRIGGEEMEGSKEGSSTSTPFGCLLGAPHIFLADLVVTSGEYYYRITKLDVWNIKELRSQAPWHIIQEPNPSQHIYWHSAKKLRAAAYRRVCSVCTNRGDEQPGARLRKGACDNPRCIKVYLDILFFDRSVHLYKSDRCKLGDRSVVV